MKRKGPRRKHLVPPTVITAKLGRRHAHGLAFDRKNLIVIDERLTGLPKLEILIHEWLHIFEWCLPEAVVYRLARKLSIFLWKHNVRIIEPGDKPLP